jgi:hypothetical protein
MFLEVYAVKRSEYTKDTEISMVPQNLRLVEMTGARIRNCDLFPERAEIVLPNKSKLLCAGSYDELVQRMMQAENGIARITD